MVELMLQLRFLSLFLFSTSLFLSLSNSESVAPTKNLFASSPARQPRFPPIWHTNRAKNQIENEIVSFDLQRQVVRLQQQNHKGRILLLYLDQQKYFAFDPSPSNCTILSPQPFPAFIESPSLFSNISFNKFSLFEDILSIQWGKTTDQVEFFEGVERAIPLELRVDKDFYVYSNTIVGNIDSSNFALPAGSSCPGEERSTPSPPKFPTLWTTTRVSVEGDLKIRFDRLKQKVVVSNNQANSVIYCDYFSNKYLELISIDTKVSCRSVTAPSCSSLIWETTDALSGLSFNGIVNEGESLLYKWTDTSHNLTYFDDAFTRLPVKAIRAGITFAYTNNQLLTTNSAFFAFSEDLGCNGTSIAIKKPHFPRKWTALVQMKSPTIQVTAKVFFDWNRMIFKYVYTGANVLQQVVFLNKNRTYFIQKEKDKDTSKCSVKHDQTTPFPLSLLNPSSIVFHGNTLINGSLTSTWTFSLEKSRNSTAEGDTDKELMIVQFDYFEGTPRNVKFQTEEWMFDDFSTVFDSSTFWVPLQVSCGFGENVTKIVPLRILEMNGLPPILVAVISTCSWMFGVFLVVFFVVCKNMYQTFRTPDQSSLSSYHRHRHQ